MSNKSVITVTFGDSGEKLMRTYGGIAPRMAYELVHDRMGDMEGTLRPYRLLIVLKQQIEGGTDLILSEV